MLNPTRHLLLAAAVLLSAGCHTSVYAPYGTPSAPPAAAPPVTPQAQPAQLNGIARYFGAPLEGANVKAYLMGRPDVLATATAGADGKFRLDFPEGTPQGALVKLVATEGARMVATVVTVPGRQVQQADTGFTYILDEARSMVFLVLGRRLEALGQLSLGQDGVVALSVTQEAFRAFADALAAVETATPMTPEAYQAVSVQALTTEGQFSTETNALQAIASLVPAGVVPIVAKHAESLAVLIRDEVATGKPQPKSVLTDRLPLGDGTVVDEVFPASQTRPNPTTTSGGSGGGGAPLKADPTPDASGALDITDGDLLNPPASASLELDL